MNHKYFGGVLETAIGWENKQCQACFKHPKKYHVHHVLSHPDHSWLVVLCAGCHEIVSKMAWRKYSDEALAALVGFAAMQRDRAKRAIRLSISPCT
jgi:hypothetical protein